METTDNSPNPFLNHGATERLAYSYWHERGCPFGTPDEDWFRAENYLGRHDPDSGKDLLVTAAKAIGGALGEIAAVLGSPLIPK